MNAQGKNRLNRFPFSKMLFAFSNPYFAFSKMHRVALLFDVFRVRYAPCENGVAQCTIGPRSATRQKLPGALKFSSGDGFCRIMAQTIPAVGRWA